MKFPLHLSCVQRNEDSFRRPKKLCPLRCGNVRIIFVAIGLSIARASYADAADAFRPFVEYSTLYQDNVLRLPGWTPLKNAPEQRKISDISHKLEMGMLIDIEYSRQHFTGWIKESLTRYQDLKQLDFAGTDLMANWLWHAGNHFYGNLGGTYLNTLAPFTDFHELSRNLRTEQRSYFDSNWRLHPSWKIRTGASRSQLNHDLQSRRFLDRVENRAEAGLDYVSRTDSSTGITFGYTKGSLPNRSQLPLVGMANNYAQYEIKGDVKWHLSDTTSLHFLGGKVYRKVEEMADKNFNGSNVRLRIAWRPTSQLSVDAAAWREIGASDYVDVLYTVNKGISMAPSWQVSEKLAIGFEIRCQRRNFTGASSQKNAGVKEDALRDLTAGVTYRPLRNTMVKLAVFHNAKSAALESARYSNNGVMISMQQTF